MSTLKESLIDLKEIKEEATKIAKKELLESVKEKVEVVAKKIFEQHLYKEDNSESISTVVDNDEFKDYLSDILDDPKNKEIEIELQVDEPSKESTENVETKTPEQSEIVTTQKSIDISTPEQEILKQTKNSDNVESIDLTNEEDLKKIEEYFNSLTEEDELEITENKTTQTNMDKNLNQTETSEVKIDETIDIDKEMSEAEKMYSEEQAAVDQPKENSDELEIDIDQLDELLKEMDADQSASDETPDEEIKVTENSEENENSEDIGDEEYDQLLKELNDVMKESDEDETSSVEDTVETHEEELDETKGLSIANSLSREVGHSDGSEGKTNHSREFEKINEDFKKLSSQLEKLISENKGLKSNIKVLKEEKETISSKYQQIYDKLYEASIEAKKIAAINKLFLEHTTTKTEKTKIVESFKSLKTRDEISTIYTKINEELSNNVPLLKEEVQQKVTKVLKSGSSTIVEQTTNQLNPYLEKINFLAKGKIKK